MTDYSPETIDAILRSFRYLHDHFYTPGAIDRAQLFASQNEINDVIAALREDRNGGRDQSLLVPPEQRDLFIHLIGYTAMILPESMASDAEVLSDLFDSFGDEDE